LVAHDGPAPPWLPHAAMDALMRTGYGKKVPEYRRRLYMEHDLPHYEVHVDIPSHPVFPYGTPWSMCVIGNDMDDTLEKAAHVVFTAMCSQCLPDIECMPIVAFPIQGHSDLEWKARIEGACDIYLEHYHAGWAYMTRFPNTCSSLNKTPSAPL
jgi:hypothetical protein